MPERPHKHKDPRYGAQEKRNPDPMVFVASFCLRGLVGPRSVVFQHYVRFVEALRSALLEQ